MTTKTDSDRAKLVQNIKDCLTQIETDGGLLEEYQEMEHRFACVLDYTTGGRMSKTNYTKEDMYFEIDDHFQHVFDEAFKEHEKELEDEIKGYVEALIKYGRHTGDCQTHGGRDCSCGWEALKTTLRV